MVVETKQTFCRFCHAFCGIEVDIEEGRAIKVRGDAQNPMYQGFTCIKGRQLPEQHAHPRSPAPLPHARPRRRLARHPPRAGHRRGGGAAGGDHRRARPPRGRHLQRHLRLLLPFLGPVHGRLHGRHWFEHDLLRRHHRPARQAHRARLPRQLGRRPPDVRRRRRVDADWGQPHHLHVGRHSPVQPREAPPRGEAPRSAVHRHRPAPHRGGGAGRYLPAGEAGRGSDPPRRHPPRHPR